jgi:hypothetical protein
MESTIHLFTIFKEALKGTKLIKIPLEKGMDRIEVEKGSSTIEIHRAERLERIILSSIDIKGAAREQTLFIWPEPKYYLPLFWCNLTRIDNRSFFILDYLPLLDPVVWPEYFEQCLKGFSTLRPKLLDVMKEFILDKDPTLPAPIAILLSPFKITISIKAEGDVKLYEIIQTGICSYLEMAKKALPVSEEEKVFLLKKRENVKRQMRSNDPGYPFMVNTFGEELTKKIFDTIF